MTQVTFQINASANDTQVYRSGASYGGGGILYLANTATTNSANRDTYGASSWETHVGLLVFDTSTLPDDAVITAATLRLYTTSKSDGDGRSITMDWYLMTGVAATDYTDTAQTGAHAGTTIASLGTSQDVDFTLSSPTSISLSGNTGLRIHISGLQPTGINNVGWRSYDYDLANATAFAPRLIVTYLQPTIVRLAPDGIVSRTNLTTWETGGVNQGTASDAQALAAIDEDPDSADTNWLTV